MAFTTMDKSFRLVASAVAVLFLGGCSLGEEGLWPSLTGEEPAGPTGAQPAERVEIAPLPAEAAASPLLEPVSAPVFQASAQPAPPGSAFAGTGTFVGQKVGSLRAELDALKGRIAAQSGEYQSVSDNAAQAAQRYHALVGEINSRLQGGTTPGNPVLVGQWQTAQRELDGIAADTSRMTELSNRIAANSDMANYLSDSTRAAYSIHGAVEEDHRQLSLIEDDLSRVMVSNDRLLNEINATISRHNSYLFGERHNLTGLALAVSTGRSYGPSLAGLASAEAPPPPAPLAAARGGTALVVIRFDRPDVDYEEALYGAISTALEQRPDARFELVAVTPLSGSPSDVAANAGIAKRNAEKVLRSLVDMGLPAERVTMASATSDTARTAEVQIYVR